MVDAYRPDTLKEALKIRAEKHAVPFLGGTDLMVQYRTQAGVLPAFPSPVLLLGHLKELSYIREGDDMLYIGAGATLNQIISHPAVPDLLKQAASQMASPALRNMATAAGNIGNASPAGDVICVLTVLDAVLLLGSARASRTVPLQEYITGPGASVLREDEIITEIQIPSAAFTCTMFRKVGTRRANALSKLSAAAAAESDRGRIASIRIALGAVAPVVLRSREIEAQARGIPLKELSRFSGELAARYGRLMQPISDQRSTAAYRRRTALAVVEQFLHQIAQEG